MTFEDIMKTVRAARKNITARPNWASYTNTTDKVIECILCQKPVGPGETCFHLFKLRKMKND